MPVEMTVRLVGFSEALCTVAGHKVVYMPGYSDDAIIHHRVLEPGLVIIQKPFSPDALARCIRKVLDSR